MVYLERFLRLVPFSRYNFSVCYMMLVMYIFQYQPTSILKYLLYSDKVCTNDHLTVEHHTLLHTTHKRRRKKNNAHKHKLTHPNYLTSFYVWNDTASSLLLLFFGLKFYFWFKIGVFEFDLFGNKIFKGQQKKWIY